MKLGFIIILTLFLHIKVSSIFNPALFLGPLAIYILSRKYWVVFIWLITIILVLDYYSLNTFWELASFYFIWSISLAIISKFIERRWSVQSIVSIFLLVFYKLIFSGFQIYYINIGIYGLVNGIGIIIFLYLAEKLNIYEKII